MFCATYPGEWRDGEIPWKQFLLLSGEVDAVHATQMLQESEAIGLALSGLSEEGQRQGDTVRRGLESVAYGMHTEAWHRKKQALERQRQEMNDG